MSLTKNISMIFLFRNPVTTVLLTSLITVFSIGCTANKHLSKEDRVIIQKVSIEDKVEMPEEMYYLGPGNFNYVGGALDYLIAAIIYESTVDTPEELRGNPQKVFELVMSKRGIKVEDIVLKTFKEKLSEKAYFEMTAEDPNAHEHKLIVVIYGLANRHGLSSYLKPMLGVRGILSNPNKEIIWKKYSYVTNLNDKTPSYTAEHLLNHPELIRASFVSAADIVVADLVADLTN